MPGETGLDRFIAWGRNEEFIGRAAVEAERAAGSNRRICAFAVEARDADVFGYEPIWIDGAVRGFCTSGGYSHYADRSVALAFVPVEFISGDLEADIEILGENCPARILLEPLYDPTGAIMRG